MKCDEKVQKVLDYIDLSAAIAFDVEVNKFDYLYTAVQVLKQYRSDFAGLFAIIVEKSEDYVPQEHLNEIKDKDLKPKFIYFDTDYATYKFPLSIVAHDRALYYAELDSDGTISDFDRIYDEEFWYTWENAEEALDYLRNQYNWSDIKNKVTVIDHPFSKKSPEQQWREAENFKVN